MAVPGVVGRLVDVEREPHQRRRRHDPKPDRADQQDRSDTRCRCSPTTMPHGTLPLRARSGPSFFIGRPTVHRATEAMGPSSVRQPTLLRVPTERVTFDSVAPPEIGRSSRWKVVTGGAMMPKHTCGQPMRLPGTWNGTRRCESTIVGGRVVGAKAPTGTCSCERIDRATRLIPMFRQHVVESPGRLTAIRGGRTTSTSISAGTSAAIDSPAPHTPETVIDVARNATMTAFDRAYPLWEFTLVEHLEGDQRRARDEGAPLPHRRASAGCSSRSSSSISSAIRRVRATRARLVR